MDENRVGKLIDFLKEMDNFKTIERKNYLRESERSETDAEHSWHLAMFIIAFDKEIPPDLDRFKMLKLALVHDLAEIHAGDPFSYDDKAREGKKEREFEAVKKLFSNLPNDLNKEFMDMYVEYEEQKTPEARLVNAFDKIQAMHQNLCSGWLTYKKHNISKEKILAYHKKYMEHSKLTETIYRKMLEEAKQEGYVD